MTEYAHIDPYVIDFYNGEEAFKRNMEYSDIRKKYLREMHAALNKLQGTPEVETFVHTVQNEIHIVEDIYLAEFDYFPELFTYSGTYKRNDEEWHKSSLYSISYKDILFMRGRGTRKDIDRLVWSCWHAYRFMYKREWDQMALDMLTAVKTAADEHPFRTIDIIDPAINARRHVQPLGLFIYPTKEFLMACEERGFMSFRKYIETRS